MLRASPSPHPLLVRFGALGDLITLTACAEALQRRWGSPCELLTGTGLARQIFAGREDIVGEIQVLSSRRTPYPLAPAQWRLVRHLRRRGPSPVYLFEDKPDVTAKLEWLLERAGLREQDLVGSQQVPRGDLEHFQAYGMRLAGTTPPAWRSHLPLPPDPRPRPRLVVSDDERSDCRLWLVERKLAERSLVLLQPHSRRENRGRWPVDSWVALSRQILTEQPGCRLLVLGAPAEQRASQELAGAIGDPRAISVADELPLRRLFALLEVAQSTISLDTGPAHAAAALGCPLVVLVGVADPRRNRPLGNEAAIRTLTAWPRERWPATRHEWESRHDPAGIGVPAVLEAWRTVAYAGRPVPTGD